MWWVDALMSMMHRYECVQGVQYTPIFDTNIYRCLYFNCSSFLWSESVGGCFGSHQRVKNQSDLTGLKSTSVKLVTNFLKLLYSYLLVWKWPKGAVHEPARCFRRTLLKVAWVAVIFLFFKLLCDNFACKICLLFKDQMFPVLQDDLSTGRQSQSSAFVSPVLGWACRQNQHVFTQLDKTVILRK